MTVVSEKIGTALDLARHQMTAFEKQLVVVEKKALSVASTVRSRVTDARTELPEQFEKAFETATGVAERGLARISRVFFGELFDRLDALERKVDALSKKKAAPKKAAAHS